MRRLPRALLTLLAVLTLCACGDKAQDGSNGENAAVAWDTLSFDKTMPLDYATQFSVSFAGDDYKRITIGQDQEFLLVAEGAAVPSGVPEGVTILQQPLDEIYLVASAAMDSFAQLDAVDSIRFSGRKESDWYIEQAKEAMSAGDMLYAGKYSEPDYELILSQGCDLVLENTMIYHSPEVIEQFETLGIPVLVEMSSVPATSRTHSAAWSGSSSTVRSSARRTRPRRCLRRKWIAFRAFWALRPRERPSHSSM